MKTKQIVTEKNCQALRTDVTWPHYHASASLRSHARFKEGGGRHAGQ